MLDSIRLVRDGFKPEDGAMVSRRRVFRKVLGIKTVEQIEAYLPRLGRKCGVVGAVVKPLRPLLRGRYRAVVDLG